MNVAADTRADVIAAEMLDVLSSGGHIAPFSTRFADFDLNEAYAAAAALRRLRMGRGERAVGRKIGFTNRAIWAQYQVFAPIWGDMYDTTVHEIASLAGPFSLAGLAEPQIEPEIVFRLGAAPTPGMNEAALADCVEWVGHCFEIVQSPFPDWRFAAPDCVVASGLHGALLLGAPTRWAGEDRAEWQRMLGTFEIELERDGEMIDKGTGANVLGHPLSALRHLVALLAEDAFNPPLAAGEIISTGTLTRAFRIAPGERWSTRIRGLPLSGIAVTLA